MAMCNSKKIPELGTERRGRRGEEVEKVRKGREGKEQLKVRGSDRRGAGDVQRGDFACMLQEICIPALPCSSKL